ncbi:MAG: PD-(D/E)XK nuclease family protein [Bacteroides sp.]|nr:PD-(D/E)XK nuclease family protein [Bacteroides sp.]
MNRLNIDALYDFINSKALLKIMAMQNEITLLDVAGKRDSESVHTSMLAWILSAPEFLNIPLPPALLMSQLVISKGIKNGKLTIGSECLKSVYVTPLSLDVNASTEWTFKNKKRIDICVELIINDVTKFRLWIENKLYTHVGYKQLESYYNSVQELADRKDFCNLFIFLSPGIENQPDHDAFIHITYQELYDRVLLPLLDQLENKADSKSVRYLNEYIATLESIDNTFNPLVKSMEYSECLKEIYDNYSDLFIAAISDNGTEEEKSAVSKISRNFEIIFNDRSEIVTGYTALARRVFELLLGSGVDRNELLKNLGRLWSTECKGIDSRVAVTREEKGTSPCYSSKTLGRPYIYFNNQWTSQKATCFIKQVKNYYPNMKIIKR